jgi:mannose-6-phosphate isomerase-like protein (cupin superfamily)
MKKEKVVKVSEIMGFSPFGSEGNYVSKLLIESEGVGSSRLMVTHATAKPGMTPYEPSAHPAPYDEVYYILRGQGRVEFDGGKECYDVAPDTAVFIPAETIHTIINTGTEPLEFLGIMPMIPKKEGVNSVYDERIKVWGTPFRKVASQSPRKVR